MTEFTLYLDDVTAISEPTSHDASAEVNIVELAEGKVRLGVTAPPEIDIHRAEIYQDIQENGRRESAYHSR